MTTSITMVRKHTEKVKPPRALFVPFPFGRPLGEPDNSDLQLRVMRTALHLVNAPSGPVLEDFPEDPYAAQDLNLPQAATVPERAPSHDQDPAFELTSLRPYYVRWVGEHGGRTAVGLTGVDQRRFRGLVRFLETYRDQGTLELPPDAPAAATPLQFLRWSADDLKAFYMEARLGQRPGSTFQDTYAWLWGETVLGTLLRAVRDRLAATGDPKLALAGQGIAR